MDGWAAPNQSQMFLLTGLQSACGGENTPEPHLTFATKGGSRCTAVEVAEYFQTSLVNLGTCSKCTQAHSVPTVIVLFQVQIMRKKTRHKSRQEMLSQAAPP